MSRSSAARPRTPEQVLPRTTTDWGDSLRESPRSPRVSSQLRADLTALVLGLLGILLLLAIFRPGSAGPFGTAMYRLLQLGFGHGVHVFPMLFLIGAVALAMDCQRYGSVAAWLGAGGVLVTFFGVIHIATTPLGSEFASTQARMAVLMQRPSEPALVAAADGGLLGALVMALFVAPLGRLGAISALGFLGFGSTLILTQGNLRSLLLRVGESSRRAGARASQTARRYSRNDPFGFDEPPGGISTEPAGRSLFLSLREGEDDPPGGASPSRLAGRSGGKGVEAGAGSISPEGRGVPATLPAPITDIRIPGLDDGALEPPAERRTAQRAAPRSPRTPAVPKAVEGAFSLPPLEILDVGPPRPRRTSSEAEANIAILENTLAQFRIQAQVVEIADGPTVTRYEIRLGEGIRVKKILDLADNIAMSLAAMSVRVEAPIPGKAAIGIEVPKKQSGVVTLRECLESAEFRDFNSRIAFVLGKDVAGNVRCADLARMPHLLVAGATNSGKSVCLNVLIASLLYRTGPDELKFIMIDPKRVELTLFDGIPHLIHPVVKDVKQAAGILRWVLKEMDRRYDLFARAMTRNIEGFNEKASGPADRLPFLIVVIDELADLMMQQGPEIEQAICRLAQLARATGIHLVIATQRPSVDVITGLIKANIPSRISFAVSSQIDSRTILDAKGAESLIGRGDMLFKPVDAAKPLRLQGAFLKETEVERVVNFLKQQGRPEYEAQPISVDHGTLGLGSEEEVEDDMFETATRFVVTTGHASTSMIQRKFKIGYTRAARLVDMMEARGIVGALDGAKPREIRMTRDQVDEHFRGIRDSLFRVDRGGWDVDEAPAGDGPEALEDEDDMFEVEIEHLPGEGRDGPA